MASKEKEERLLILCVDRDDDIGLKTEEKTPILGRKENLNAAISLALKDPEEPDANGGKGNQTKFSKLQQSLVRNSLALKLTESW